MTMCASRIGTVPTEGFNWYVVLLEGPFADAIREQIDRYFRTLGKEAGPDVLVVTDALPTAVEQEKGLDQARVMVFPLRKVYERDKDVSVFFARLLSGRSSASCFGSPAPDRRSRLPGRGMCSFHRRRFP